MTVEVHHLSRLALKCNLLGDRRQARRKHRQLHLGHPTSLGQLSPPRNRSAHYRSKGTYPDDQDLIGNLLVAQTALEEFADAAETAKLRLARGRDVHSLHEVAALHCSYASKIRELDWPLAVKNLK